MKSLADLVLHHHRDIALAETSVEKANELLVIAAGYLERREVMPPLLADYIAQAFRITAGMTKDEHEKQPLKLAQLLNLTAQNRRAKYIDADIQNGMHWYAYSSAAFKWSETFTIKQIAATWKVSQSQARTMWKQWTANNQGTMEHAAKFAKSYTPPND